MYLKMKLKVELEVIDTQVIKTEKNKRVQEIFQQIRLLILNKV